MHGRKPTGEQCKHCEAPLYNVNASGFCALCSRLLRCAACGKVHPETKSHFCPECAESWAAWQRIMNSFQPVRPDAVTLRERLVVYEWRAVRELPLFQEGF